LAPIQTGILFENYETNQTQHTITEKGGRQEVTPHYVAEPHPYSLEGRYREEKSMIRTKE